MRRLIALAIIAMLAGCGPSEEADRIAVIAVMHKVNDKPGLPVDVGPVVVEGGHAVADWTQGEMGGRALLVRKDHGWVITLCAGDILRTRDGLVRLGVPDAQAATLADELAAAEASVLPGRLKRMAEFQGLMRMDEGH